MPDESPMRTSMGGSKQGSGVKGSQSASKELPIDRFSRIHRQEQKRTAPPPKNIGASE